MNRPHALALMIMTALLAGCAHGHGYRFDPDTTVEEQAATVKAIMQWNAVTTGDAHMTLDVNGDYRITFTATGLTPNLDGRECTTVGTDCAYAKWIRVRRDPSLNADDTLSIVKHELGHSIGLKHVNDPTGLNRDHPDALMYSAHMLGNAGAFTQDDIDECIRAGSCSPIQVRTITPASPAAVPRAVRTPREW